MKPGRNDPCPCGSGKKYKHCCLLKDDAPPDPDDLAWRRVMRATEGLPAALLRTAKSHFGAAALDEAWDEFNLWEIDEPFDPDTPHMPVFMPWFLFDWLPDSETTDVPEAACDTTAAQAYLRAAGQRLDPLIRRYVEAAAAARFSFHEIVSCTRGRGFRLRDVLLGSEADVLERKGSTGVTPGDLLYAKVVPIEGIAVLEGCTPVLIPPRYKTDLIDFRSEVSPEQGSSNAGLLREYDFELRELYLSIAHELLYPSAPAVANTDGDPLEFHTLVYDIDSPRRAFDALKDLADGMPEDELLQGAELDAAGDLVRAEILWRRAGNPVHAGMENTTLGTIRIAPSRLEADVNSAERAAKLRVLIEQRLGDHARFRIAKVESLQSLMDRKRTPQEEAAARERQAEHERLAALPEVQAKIAEMMRKHYRSWVDQKIPALGDRTPRDAVRDPDGREAVEALINQAERDGALMKPPLDPEILTEVRAVLGLKKEA